MRTMHTADGSIGVYYDELGTPFLKCANLFLPLVNQTDKRASRVRIRQGFALSLTGLFNFKRILIAPFIDGTDIVFPRANGQEMFRLKVAGSEG